MLTSVKTVELHRSATFNVKGVDATPLLPLVTFLSGRAAIGISVR